MSTFDLTADNLNASIQDNDILVIDFWASWCGPCRSFAPTFEAASERYPDIAFAKCNTEEQRAVAGSFSVRSIPTLAVFREGVLVFSQPGALPAAALDDLIGQVGALDMKEVHAQVAAQQEQTA